MRFTHKPRPKTFDARHFRRFLWFPKTIGQETRWLEVAEWTEFYCGGMWHNWTWGHANPVVRGGVLRNRWYPYYFEEENMEVGNG